MSLLKTLDLSIGYLSADSPRVLQRQINVSLEKGEIVSLLGQNGVGKTTLIKTISGLQNPIEGAILFSNSELSSIGKKDLSTRLSLVLTEKPASLNLTVIELISLGRQPYSNWIGELSSKDKEVIEKVITDTKINYIANRKLFELSDGQLQIAMIARALAQDTDLIILDEPTAHLDLHNKIAIMKLLREIADSGKGILISTHDIQLSTQLSDRLWLMNFNSKILEGTPEDLILNGHIHETLFLDRNQFDIKTGVLKIRKPDLSISVQGNEDVVFWTKRALERKGYKIEMNSKIKVNCNSRTDWIVTINGKSISCSEIDGVLKALAN